MIGVFVSIGFNTLVIPKSLPLSEKTMKETIVLYPAPAIGHTVSVVELGKLISHHQPHLSIIILVTSMPSDTTTISSYTKHISQETNNLPLSFHFLPSIPHQEGSTQVTSFEFIRLNVPNVLNFLDTLSLNSKILALITSAVHDSYHPNIPTYYYFTSCASCLSTFLHFPSIHSRTTKSFKDLPNTFFEIPGLPPIRASYFPKPLLDRDDHFYHQFLNFATYLPKAKGIIVKTFDSLEPKAIRAIADQDCVPNGSTPPIYCIGPLIANANDRAVGAESSPDERCLLWLNEQPSRGVVYMCFGSRGRFAAAQMKEIAIGLERSGHRFLWAAPQESEFWQMPEGEEFMERTKGRGLVVNNSWAPQADILSHESVGGFFTHCGWNSVVEAVSEGVPMVAWPLYAEQHLNSVVLVEEMKLAMPIDEDLSSSSSDGGLVSRDVIELRVRDLMSYEEARGGLRKRSLEMKAMTLAAWEFGGSSLAAFSNLVGSWKKHQLETWRN